MSIIGPRPGDVESKDVSVHNRVPEERAVMTAALIQDCFEKRNTGIREAACQYRINRLADEMNVLYKTLEKHKKDPELQRYKRSLRALMIRIFTVNGVMFMIV